MMKKSDVKEENKSELQQKERKSEEEKFSIENEEKEKQIKDLQSGKSFTSILFCKRYTYESMQDCDVYKILSWCNGVFIHTSA